MSPGNGKAPGKTYAMCTCQGSARSRGEWAVWSASTLSSLGARDSRTHGEISLTPKEMKALPLGRPWAVPCCPSLCPSVGSSISKRSSRALLQSQSAGCLAQVSSPESTVRGQVVASWAFQESGGPLVYCLDNGLSQKNRKDDSLCDWQQMELEMRSRFGEEDSKSSLEPVVLQLRRKMHLRVFDRRTSE